MSDSTGRILVAEDDETLRYLVERQLTFLNYQVDQAENGMTAVNKALTTRYDLILMDVMMPDLDGFESAQRIRADKEAPSFKTPIIAMTAFADKQKCLDAGMDDFILKPVLLQPLKLLLQKWLNLPVSEADATESSFKKTRNNLAAIEDRIKQLRERHQL